MYIARQTKLFLVAVYCLSCCLAYMDEENLYLEPGDYIVAIRPRRSSYETAAKRSSLSRSSEKRVQMINDLINYMNDAERLRFGR